MDITFLTVQNATPISEVSQVSEGSANGFGLVLNEAMATANPANASEMLNGAAPKTSIEAQPESTDQTSDGIQNSAGLQTMDGSQVTVAIETGAGIQTADALMATVGIQIAAGTQPAALAQIAETLQTAASLDPKKTSQSVPSLTDADSMVTVTVTGETIFVGETSTDDLITLDTTNIIVPAQGAALLSLGSTIDQTLDGTLLSGITVPDLAPNTATLSSGPTLNVGTDAGITLVATGHENSADQELDATISVEQHIILEPALSGSDVTAMSSGILLPASVMASGSLDDTIISAQPFGATQTPTPGANTPNIMAQANQTTGANEPVPSAMASLGNAAGQSAPALKSTAATQDINSTPVGGIIARQPEIGAPTVGQNSPIGQSSQSESAIIPSLQNMAVESPRLPRDNAVLGLTGNALTTGRALGGDRPLFVAQQLAGLPANGAALQVNRSVNAPTLPTTANANALAALFGEANETETVLPNLEATAKTAEPVLNELRATVNTQVNDAPRVSFETTVSTQQSVEGPTAARPISNTESAAPALATRHAALAGAPVQQVAVFISKAVQDGVNKFSIRLHPAELGRVHVAMEVANDGRVTAVVSAERQDTLDLLQRDSRSLVRALQDHGLKADSGSLNFSLQGDNDGSERAGDGGSNGTGPGQTAASFLEDAGLAVEAAIRFQHVDNGGSLDITI